MRRIVLIPFLLLFALSASGFQQTPDATAKSIDETHAKMVGLVRTIITIELSEQADHGSYATWPVLLQHHSEEFNDWLTRFWSPETPQRFSDLSEVLPGLKLQLITDGRSYMLLLQDTQDKDGFAFVGDQSGIIRESKYIK